MRQHIQTSLDNQPSSACRYSQSLLTQVGHSGFVSRRAAHTDIDYEHYFWNWLGAG